MHFCWCTVMATIMLVFKQICSNTIHVSGSNLSITIFMLAYMQFCPWAHGELHLKEAGSIGIHKMHAFHTFTSYSNSLLCPIPLQYLMLLLSMLFQITMPLSLPNNSQAATIQCSPCKLFQLFLSVKSLLKYVYISLILKMCKTDLPFLLASSFF